MVACDAFESEKTKKISPLAGTVNVIDGTYCETANDIVCFGSHPAVIKRSFFDSFFKEASTKIYWHFNHPNIISPDRVDCKENGEYTYEYDAFNRLISLKSHSFKKDKIYHELSFEYDSINDQSLCRINSIDGRSLTYFYHKTPEASRNSPGVLIDRVIGVCGEETKYEYAQHPVERKYLLKKMTDPEGGYIENEYYSGKYNNVNGQLVMIKDFFRDPSIGKIKLQKAPLGPENSPIVTQQFFYHRDYTDIVCCNGLKNRYYFSKYNNIKKLETYLKGSLSPYKTQNFYWSPKTENSESRLKCIALVDGLGDIHSCETYRYSSAGILSEKKVYGNISGHCTSKIILSDDDIPIENGVEVASTNYEYQEETALLTKKTEASGKITEYRYDPQTKKNSAIFIEDKHRILIRQFFLYNQEGIVVKTITDDGTSEVMDDLENVTERHVLNYCIVDEPYGLGLPASVEECYCDLESGREYPIMKTVNRYNAMHLLDEQWIYDSQGILIKFVKYTYDKAGRCTYFGDSFNNEKFIKYDLCGRVIEEILIENGSVIKKINNLYDLCGRLISCSEFQPNQGDHQLTFQYDGMNHCTTSIDQYGHETHYVYDELGRLSVTKYPASMIDGQIVNPLIQQEYDIANNIVKTIDPKGYATHTTYNIQGNPVLIIHADGTREEYRYHLDGSLCQKTSCEGLTTCYERDILGRVTVEKVFSSSGSLIASTEYCYSAFHLLSSTDLSGTTVSYFYRQDGKLCKTEKTSGNSIQTTEYEYDSQGRQCAEKQKYGLESDAYFKKNKVFDTQGNVTQIFIEDAHGKIIRESTSAEEKNILNSPSNVIWDQEGQKSIFVDGNGVTLITVYDALSRPIHIMKKNSMDKLLFEVAYEYDLSGNKTKEIYTLLNNNFENQRYIIKKKYGPKNRLEYLIEGEGSRNQRIFSYDYNALGKLETIVKPDGISISYIYNDSGQVERFYSSDQSIDYEYTYDLSGNVIRVYDHVHEKVTEKAYNKDNQVIEEKLANDLTLSYAWDAWGRNLRYILPDQSFVNYIYDGIDLVQVDRYLPEGMKIYSHKYTNYDLHGRLLKSEMIRDLGSIHYAYNEQNTCSKITSPFWKTDFILDTENRAISTVTCDFLGETKGYFEFNSENALSFESDGTKKNYDYDSLGNRIAIDQIQSIYSELNELTFDGFSCYAYDLNGNQIEMTNDNSRKEFVYDALNRLSHVYIDKTTKISFVYDSLSRRLEKLIYSLDTKDQWEIKEKIRYIYQGNNEVGSVNENNEIIELRILGLTCGSESGASVALEIEGEIFAPIHDTHGNIRTIVAVDTRSIKECYRYTGYGLETLFDENKNPLCSECSLNPWRYSGKRVDQETHLVFYGKRYYQPHTGRWTTLDPLGLYDGVNRYLFTHNNPITNSDHYGMFSISTAWHKCISFFNGWFNTIKDCGSIAADFIYSETDYLYQPSMNHLLENFFGKGFLTMLGYYGDPLENGVYGQGEVHDKVRITLLNGILNARWYYAGTLDLLTKSHAGTNIHYIFRPSGGWCIDLIQGMLIKCGYISPHAKALAATWKKLIEEMGGVEGGGKIIHYCHSLGGADTVAAACLLTPDELSMIQVISFGSATIISDSIGFADAVNYISVRDGVSLVADPVGYIRGLIEKNSNVNFIGSFFGPPLIDHALAVRTYTDLIISLGSFFMQTYANAM